MHKRLLHSSVFLGALTVSSLTFAAVTPYSQNFEDLVQSSLTALSGDGWIHFGTAFDDGAFVYGYGPFPAPNDQAFPNISSIADGEGGTSQGTQQVNIFGDYNNVDMCNANLYEIEANVFQEQIITLADIGNTWVFRFDAKLGNLDGSTTAQAFIKTIHNVTFDQTNLVAEDTTTYPTTWTEQKEISLALDATDDVDNTTNLPPADGIPDLVGQFIQFGFSNITQCGDGSGVFYDNVEWFDTDADGDGVTHDVDNCTAVANAGQQDSNGDGFGNICDGDFDNDCTTGFLDLGIFKLGFFGTNPDLDLDSDGGVAFLDLGIFRGLFFTPPGPSGLASCP